MKMIVAADLNNAIGYKNDLLCRIKGDMGLFKLLTVGTGRNAVVMGRKTFESLPNGALPDRDNYVITSDLMYNAPNAMVIKSLDDLVNSYRIEYNYDDIFVIGGAKVFNDAFIKGYIDRIYLTRIFTKFEHADKFIFNIDDFCGWKKEETSDIMVDKPTTLKYQFLVYSKVDPEV